MAFNIWVVIWIGLPLIIGRHARPRREAQNYDITIRREWVSVHHGYGYLYNVSE